MSTNSPKPPLGLTPEFIRRSQRVQEIVAAVDRYVCKSIGPIPDDWMQELLFILRRHQDTPGTVEPFYIVVDGKDLFIDVASLQRIISRREWCTLEDLGLLTFIQIEKPENKAELEAKHRQELVKAEEAGYSRGLKDYTELNQRFAIAKQARDSAHSLLMEVAAEIAKLHQEGDKLRSKIFIEVPIAPSNDTPDTGPFCDSRSVKVAYDETKHVLP